MRDPSDPYADERTADGPTPDQLWAEHQARTARENRAQAITDCKLCDPDGYRGTTVCDHTEHRDAARRGIELIRQTMGWTNTKEKP